MAVDENHMPNIVHNADDLGDLSMKISKWVHPKPSERTHMCYIALALRLKWYTWRKIWFYFNQKSFTCYQNFHLSYKNSLWKFFAHFFYSASHFLHFNFSNQFLIFNNQFHFPNVNFIFPRFFTIIFTRRIQLVRTNGARIRALRVKMKTVPWPDF